MKSVTDLRGLFVVKDPELLHARSVYRNHDKTLRHVALAMIGLSFGRTVSGTKLLR
jgi:hypothetical protein